MPTSIARMAAALLTVVGLTMPAGGQDALGDGHALDANPSATSRQNRPVMGPWGRFGDRNRIITGNVVGGRGFRDTVGYTAAWDFRGDTGSDELFPFRADSALSGIDYVNAGGTFQQLRFGQGIGLFETRRASEGTAPSTTAAGPVTSWAPQQGLFLAGLDLVSASVSLQAAREAGAHPDILGMFADTEGASYYWRASEFAGLTQTPTSQMTQLIGLSTYDHARVTQDVEDGRLPDAQNIGFQFDANYLDLEVPTGLRDGLLIERAATGEDETPEEDDTSKPAFQRIQERIAARYAQYAEMGRTETDAWLQTLDTDLDALKAFLRGGAPIPDEGAELDAADEDGLTLPELKLPRGDEPVEGDEDETDPGLMPPTTLAPILRHGTTIDTLRPADATRFDEIMTEGETRLARGEYFWAERRFARALRFVPGHPLATAGLAHAQLGGGLYHSASTNIRRLFTERPEMIDTRYEPALVPPRDRLERAMTTLDTRLERDLDTAASALLLAYTGRLLDDRAVMERGLAAMRRVDPKDPLIPLLEAVWLP